MKFQVQVLDAEHGGTFEAPDGCDSYPHTVEVCKQLGGMALVVVWRVTPPPIPTEPPRKTKGKSK